MEIPAADIRTKKAIASREEVIGILDDTGNFRSELQTDLDVQLTALNDFISA